MELKLPSPEQLERAYYRDLKNAFPPSELKPLENIQAMCRDGCYRPWCLFDGDELAGECFLWAGHSGWALLDYLCVSQDRRNSGLGALLLERMLVAEPEDMVILAESEAPLHAPDPALAERRLGFYARNRARTAGYDTDIFGVHYKTLYWSKKEVPDQALMEEHRFIYQSRFSPEKYARFVRIPRDPQAEPFPPEPWTEN